ncbi:uncharacterized protein LOC110114671 [Dendrobium catenatum]|uniref:uncharacterized protein LOC110114671 n=1 Tax=Dendrobium catenatum TaxID=906689 RepID=UPI00109FEBDB|nr:uncharacterized protein LOC110114671 [Dendrobium catenatum]
MEVLNAGFDDLSKDKSVKFLDTMFPCSKDKSMRFLYPHNLAQQTFMASITFSRFILNGLLLPTNRKLEWAFEGSTSYGLANCL